MAERARSIWSAGTSNRLTAHSEPYNRKAILKSDVAARTYGSQRRHRSEVCSPMHDQSLWGFAAEQSEAGRSEKHQSLWRHARVVTAHQRRRTLSQFLIGSHPRPIPLA